MIDFSYCTIFFHAKRSSSWCQMFYGSILLVVGLAIIWNYLFFSQSKSRGEVQDLRKEQREDYERENFLRMAVCSWSFKNGSCSFRDKSRLQVCSSVIVLPLMQIEIIVYYIFVTSHNSLPSPLSPPLYVKIITWSNISAPVYCFMIFYFIMSRTLSFWHERTMRKRVLRKNQDSAEGIVEFNLVSRIFIPPLFIMWLRWIKRLI